MNKGISTLVSIIIIAAVAIVLGGGFLAWQQGWLTSPQTNKPQQITQDETADWETYDNQIYNFQIKYPKDWNLQKEVGVPPATIIGKRWDDNGYCSMTLLIVENEFPATAEMDWYRQNGYKEEAYTIAGMTGAKFSKFPVDGNRPFGVIYFKNNSDRIDMVASTDKYQECSSVFDKMLFSFKFVAQNLFVNPNGKYSFEYPSAWKAAINQYNNKNSLFGPGANSATGLGGVEIFPNQSSIDNFLQSTEAQYTNKTSITVDGVSGIRAYYKGVPSSGESVFLLKDGNLYNIYIGSDDEQEINLFNQLVSTFKFIN